MKLVGEISELLLTSCFGGMKCEDISLMGKAVGNDSFYIMITTIKKRS